MHVTQQVIPYKNNSFPKQYIFGEDNIVQLNLERILPVREKVKIEPRNLKFVTILEASNSTASISANAASKSTDKQTGTELL